VAHISPVFALDDALPSACASPHVTLAADLAAIASYEADEAYARACGAYNSSLSRQNAVSNRVTLLMDMVVHPLLSSTLSMTWRKCHLLTTALCSRFRTLFIDDPSDDEDAYYDLLPTHNTTQRVDSSPPSSPLLQAASPLQAPIEHTPYAMVVGSSFASPSIPRISANVPPDLAIFRERRRSLHVLSLCDGGVPGIIAHLV
jgi:hypothetical protein